MSESSKWTDDAAGQARDAGAAVHERVRGEVDERSTAVGEQTGKVGRAVRDMSDTLMAQGNDLPARAAEEAADRIERLARYLRESDGDQILNDLEDFGRRQPLVVAALGLAAGAAAARLLKASGGRPRSGATRRASGPGSPIDATAPTEGRSG